MAVVFVLYAVFRSVNSIIRSEEYHLFCLCKHSCSSLCNFVDYVIVDFSNLSNICCLFCCLKSLVLIYCLISHVLKKISILMKRLPADILLDSLLYVKFVRFKYW